MNILGSNLKRYDRISLSALGLWILISIYCFAQSLIRHRLNNYLIFENTFLNLIKEQSLYTAYPQIHDDTNHYGPVFGVFMAPFALLSTKVGLLFWNLFNCLLLFKAISTIKMTQKNIIYFIALPCFVSSMLSQQFNPATAALIIFSYTLRNHQKGLWSAFFIMLGTFIKLYGIIGLAFFFFVQDKRKFVLYLFFWSVILFCLPMLFSSPAYIINSYKEWAISLGAKNALNIASLTCDISIMGFVRSLFNRPIPNLYFLIVGAGIFFLPYLNFIKYHKNNFQLSILASVLLFPVLFSSGSEDCTYIIAVVGVGIWYTMAKRTLADQLLLAAVILSSFDFPLMLFPDFTTLHPIFIKMISVPFFLVWLKVIKLATSMAPVQDQHMAIQV
ncbi:glycosyltransferase family 87 protein [Pedobacter sp. ASV28]|uniref:glycosyltransferase family 87 protein n=1 Tax=Pedobacter sp. ASV28 TaxID=2795123 RepID=UPI0018EB8F27|nr:glycosyltransferase family 87 protein [Pedobacter sp. ASV28]